MINADESHVADKHSVNFRGIFSSFYIVFNVFEKFQFKLQLEQNKAAMTFENILIVLKLSSFWKISFMTKLQQTDFTLKDTKG